MNRPKPSSSVSWSRFCVCVVLMALSPSDHLVRHLQTHRPSRGRTAGVGKDCERAAEGVEQHAKRRAEAESRRRSPARTIGLHYDDGHRVSWCSIPSCRKVDVLLLPTSHYSRQTTRHHLDLLTRKAASRSLIRPASSKALKLQSPHRPLASPQLLVIGRASTGNDEGAAVCSREHGIGDRLAFGIAFQIHPTTSNYLNNPSGRSPRVTSLRPHPQRSMVAAGQSDVKLAEYDSFARPPDIQQAPRTL